MINHSRKNFKIMIIIIRNDKISFIIIENDNVLLLILHFIYKHYELIDVSVSLLNQYSLNDKYFLIT